MSFSVRTMRFCVVLAASIGTIGLGCTPPPKSAPPASSLTVADRLLPPSTPEERSAPPACGLAGEIRPAIGCMEKVLLKQTRRPNRYSVGANGFRRDVLVEKRTRPNKRSKWRSAGWAVVRDAGMTIRPRFPKTADDSASEETRLEAWKFPPSLLKTIETSEITIAAGTILEGGIGLDDKLPDDVVAPVLFEIEAQSTETGATSSLYRRVVEPQERLNGWIDYRIDLDQLAGQTVRLEFSARLTGDAVGKIAFPLWSRPLLLERTETVRPNFIVVSLDTLRADHVGAYGSPDAVTPVLDALAESSVVFEAATTTFPSTTASHTSLLTGLYPTVHNNLAPPQALERGVPTLPQILAAEGYTNAAVTENGMIVAHSGFLRGFDAYTEFKDAQAAGASGHVEKVLDVGLSWLRAHRDDRFFLFLHTYQVHAPYNPPESFDRFGSPESAGLERHRAAYRGEVLYVDTQLQKLIDTLTELDLNERTVLVVTADHGEGFGESGVVGHGHHLTEELMRIPLIVRAPDESSLTRRYRPHRSRPGRRPDTSRSAGTIPRRASPRRRDSRLRDVRRGASEGRTQPCDLGRRHEVAVRDDLRHTPRLRRVRRKRRGAVRSVLRGSGARRGAPPSVHRERRAQSRSPRPSNRRIGHAGSEDRHRRRDRAPATGTRLRRVRKTPEPTPASIRISSRSRRSTRRRPRPGRDRPTPRLTFRRALRAALDHPTHTRSGGVRSYR